jgi:hypothetical protein
MALIRPSSFTPIRHRPGSVGSRTELSQRIGERIEERDGTMPSSLPSLEPADA